MIHEMKWWLYWVLFFVTHVVATILLIWAFVSRDPHLVAPSVIATAVAVLVGRPTRLLD